MEDGGERPLQAGEGTVDRSGWRYLELVYDRDQPAQLRIDGVVLSDGRSAPEVVSQLGRDGWEMVGSTAGAGTDQVLWFKQALKPDEAGVLPASPTTATLHDVTLVSAGNSWFDPTARARLIGALQELTGESGWRAGRMVDKAPRVVAGRVTREEADRIRGTLEALGATVEID